MYLKLHKLEVGEVILKLRFFFSQNQWPFHRPHRTTNTTNLKHKSFLFSKACSSSCILSWTMSSLFTLSSNWSPEDCLLFPRPSHHLSHQGCFPSLTIHSELTILDITALVRASVFFLLKITITVCKPCLSLQVWVPLVHSHDAAWESLVKCKSERISLSSLPTK